MIPAVSGTPVPPAGISFRKPLLAFVASTLLIAFVGLYAFHRLDSLIEADELADLKAITDMKAEQVATWRFNQKRLGETAARNSVLAAEFAQWLQEGALPSERMQRLHQMLVELQRANSYKTLLLLDRKGAIRIPANPGFDLGTEHTRQALLAMNSREVAFLEFHRNSFGDKGISLDLIVPLTVAGKNAERVVGALVLQIDPYQFLYPLIRSWPIDSASAETLLVRQDGSDVLFLSDLRFKKDTALSWRIPLVTSKLPAAMAVRGEIRTTDAVDYRGVQVVAEMRHVPGTSWYMVSKIDRDELFAPIVQLKRWTAMLGLVFAGIGGLLVLVWLRGYRARLNSLQVQHAAAVEREMLLRHFEYLTKYANDIILVTDEAGNIVEANERAQQAYGYRREELLHMPIGKLCDPSADPGLYQLKGERYTGLCESRFESVNRRKEGEPFPVDVSARDIEMEGGRYFQFIIRDIRERKQAETLLLKNRELLKKSQQMAHIGSWELDLKQNILYWTDENYRIFEIDQNKFGASYEAFLATVHPDDRDMVNQAYTNSVNNKKPYNIVHRLLFADQRVKYVQEWCETEYDASGQPVRSIGTTQDVTVQQLFQQALRKSAQQVEDLYNHAPCGYHSLDKDGLILQINDTELQWLGYTRDEVVGKINFAALFTPASLQAFRINYPAFKQRGFVNELEYELVRKDGTRFFVLLSSKALYAADGEYLMSRTTLFDITVRKLAEKQLEESEERFRIMADSAPIMIWMAEAHEQTSCYGCYGCNYFNHRWYEFTGLPPERGLSCDWQSVIHADDKKRFLNAYREGFQNEQPFSIEYRLCRHDGVFRWIQDSAAPRFGADGKFLGFIGTCIDVTDHKLFEELRGEMEHVGRLQIAGEMASGLAHELSQPVSAAGNYLSASLHHMAEQDWDKEKLLKTVSLAHAQTQRAGEMINHLKDLVRKRRQEHNLLDINALVRDTVHFMEYDIRQKAVAVLMDFHALPLMLACKIEIEQVMINLIRNAIDSMASAPQRELRLSTRVIAAGSVMVSVSDTGSGIGADELDKVFSPFQSSKKEGLGLGLAICRSLVENHGGQIWAERHADGGTVLNFTLPAKGGL